MKWDIDELSSLCAERGREALKGEQNALRDAAVLGAAMVLMHTGQQASIREACKKTRAVIDSGEALARLEAGL